jgi:hypothetical protein
VDSPLSSVEDISKFFGINTVADKIPTFDELQKINPKFFRSGKKDSWRETVTVEQKKIFWEKNFLSMIDFDYDLEADCGQGKMIYRSVKSAAKILSTYGRINPHQIDNSDHWRLDGMFDFFQSEIKKKNELLDVFQGEIKKKNELLNGAWEASNSLVGEKNKLEVELSNAALQLSELAVERDGLINEFSVERDGLISDFSVERDGLKNALQECLSQLNNTKNLLNINSADIVSLKNRNLHFFEEFDAVKNSTSLRLGRAIVLPISSLLARGRKIWRFLTPSRQELRNRIVLNKLKRKFSKDPSQFSVAFELAIVQGRLGNNKEAVRLMRKVARSSYKESREAQLFLSGKSST